MGMSMIYQSNSMYTRVFLMIHYRRILELHDEKISFRGIVENTGNSRQKITEIINLAKRKGLVFRSMD